MLRCAHILLDRPLRALACTLALCFVTRSLSKPLSMVTSSTELCQIQLELMQAHQEGLTQRKQELEECCMRVTNALQYYLIFFSLKISYYETMKCRVDGKADVARFHERRGTVRRSAAGLKSLPADSDATYVLVM